MVKDLREFRRVKRGKGDYRNLKIENEVVYFMGGKLTGRNEFRVVGTPHGNRDRSVVGFHDFVVSPLSGYSVQCVNSLLSGLFTLLYVLSSPRLLHPENPK